MPVLEKESAVWPDDLFESTPTVVAGGKWCVLHTRARMEKCVARFLRGAMLSYYLPQHEQVTKYQRRTVHSYLPLFPGYVFARVDDESALRCRQRREVVNLLPVKNQELFETQIRGIHTLLESGSPVTREERLEPGMAAQIVRGPLKGLHGHVLKNHRGGLRFVLEVQFIQQAASVEVDGEDIRAL